MPIEFVCACGRRLRVADQHAGKLARCPACRGVAEVPALLPSVSDLGFAEESSAANPAADQTGLELVEESAPEPDEDYVELEVVEKDASEPADDYWELEEVKPGPPAGVTPAAPAEPRAAADGGDGENAERPRKNRKKSPPGGEKGLSGAYMSAARAQLELEDKERVRLRGSRGAGLTLFNIHFTAGVIGGGGMLLSGLTCLAVLAILAQAGVFIYNPRIFIVAFVYTGLGAITLIRSLVYGQED